MFVGAVGPAALSSMETDIRKREGSTVVAQKVAI